MSVRRFLTGLGPMKRPGGGATAWQPLSELMQMPDSKAPRQQNILRLRRLRIWGVGSSSPGLSRALGSTPEHVSSRGAHAPECPELSGASGSNPEIQSIGSVPGSETILLSDNDPQSKGEVAPAAIT
ncbi:hypothetical protein FRC09_006173, partial [Ceratobasidium sp. 395]